MTSVTSNPSDFQELLESLRLNPHRVFLLDGGTGEELFRRGVPDDRKIWSATAVVHEKYHGILRETHIAYIHAGSQAITTNSYSITPGVGFDLDQIARFVDTAGRVARSAVEGTGAFVLGSLGPLVESYRPDLVMDNEKGTNIYRVMIRSLAPYVDAFLAETMSCTKEIQQVVDALMNERIEKPLMCSLTLASDGKLRDDQPVPSAIQDMLSYTDTVGFRCLSVISFNCTQPEAITVAFEDIQRDVTVSECLRERGILLGAYANALTSVPSDWTMETSARAQPFRTDMNPHLYYEQFVSKWINKYGIQLVGGCCGILPEHIAEIKKHMRTL